MKDMVTNGTGNSRYLKTSLASGTTWESALAMLREGTFPIDLNGLNNGGITQLGSAYSKANVLPDDVCAALGLDDSMAEPKDAFALLSVLAKNVVIEKITESCIWTAPKAIGQKFRVYGVGGGGSGGRGSYYSAGGGGGGNINIATVTIPQNTAVSVVCGAGGVAPYEGNSPGSDGGDSMFGSYLTATKGRGGGGGVVYAAKGGDGGAGGGGGIGGAGGNGGTYGGGGGGGGWYDDTQSHTAYRGGNGGNGGTYGGGGGGGGTNNQYYTGNAASGGTGGEYGGNGGRGALKKSSLSTGANGATGHSANFEMLSDYLLQTQFIRYGPSAGGDAVSARDGVTGGGGGGGYGSVGGNSRNDSGSYPNMSAGGGGGGGYGGNGGNSAQTGYPSAATGGGGGGGYFGQGGDGVHYSGGGGGGLFANGGSAKNSGPDVRYGGGGAGISDATYGNGTSGGFYILYYKED